MIPKMLVHREVADTDADELIVTDTMRERKQIMEDRTDAFIALPGGIGTLEELFETWTGGIWAARQAGRDARPARPLRRPAGMAVRVGRRRYISQAALDRLVVTDDVGDALAVCAPG